MSNQSNSSGLVAGLTLWVLLITLLAGVGFGFYELVQFKMNQILQ